MRRSLFRGVVVTGGLFVLISMAASQTASAQAESDTLIEATESDAEAPTKRSKEGSLSIRIDEHGFRIQGAVDTEDTLDSKRRIIFESDDKRVISGTVRYREKGTDIVKFGEDVYVAHGELVRGDLVVFGGDVIIEGKVVGNVVVMAGNAEARSGAEVNGDVIVIGGTLGEEADAVIHGERVMFKDLGLPFDMSEAFGTQFHYLQFFFVPVQFFVSIILSFLIILFLKDRIVRSQEHVMDSFLKSFGAGFLVMFIGSLVVAFLTTILIITLIGIPLALVLIVSCVAVFIVSCTVFAYALGTKVTEILKLETTNPFAIVLIGTAVLYLPALVGYGISLLPLGGPVGGTLKFLGVLIAMFAYLVGLGSLFLSRFGSRGIDVAHPPAAPAPAVS